MSSLGQNFGMEPLITKPLAVISDARIGSRTDKTSVTERLLSISGEDQLTVDRKHREHWTGRLPTRFMIYTNELPALNDESSSLVGRFLLFLFPNSFYGKEKHDLTDELLAESSGILLWGLVGYQRLMQRGYFIQPEASKEAVEELEMLGSPIKAFVRDRCDVGSGLEIDKDVIFDAWKSWCAENGAHIGSKTWFGRNLLTAMPGVRRGRRGSSRNDPKHMYVGVALRGDQPGRNAQCEIIEDFDSGVDQSGN